MRTSWSTALLGALASLALAAPAHGATTPNSCRYSFDGLYRDMPVAIDTIVSGAPTEVVAGQTLRTAAGTAGVELPGYRAQSRYAVGLLHEGRNDIPVKVWLAIRATNTKEAVQRTLTPIEVVASTTITVDPADDNRFLSATPFSYTTPVVPELTWTAVGGDVVFAQDGGGSLPPLPVGNGDAVRTVTGSAVIKASFAGGASIYMDCRPGHTTGIEFDFAGPTFASGPATPFASVAGPKNLMCLRSAEREFEPVAAALSTTGAPGHYTVGVRYPLPAVTLTAALPADLGAAAPLAVAVTIAGANTAEATQTVTATAAYDPATGLGPIVLPETAWTPTGAGDLRFTLETPGSEPPFGSARFALSDDAKLDCVPAAIRVIDPSVPFAGAGRYAFDPNLGRPVFASAVNSEQPAPTASVTPPPVATSVPTIVPSPRLTVKAPAGRIASTRLTSRGGKLELRLACPTGSSLCRGAISVVSASKLKLGKRAKTVTLTRRASYSIAPGKLRTVTLSLSQDGRSALKRHRMVKTRVTITTSAGVSATRRVTLAQRRGS
jgi:hypothetical protein